MMKPPFDLSVGCRRLSEEVPRSTGCGATGKQAHAGAVKRLDADDNAGASPGQDLR